MTVETKDLRLLKNDYGHKVKSVSDRLSRLERRIDWVEKLLWLSAGALISWLLTILLRSL